MEAADGDIKATRTKRARHVQGTRELVRLHADEEDDARSGACDAPGDAVFRDDGIAFIPAVECQRYVSA